MTLGSVYILSNGFTPGWCKIGFTTRTVPQRVRELSTGSPGGLKAAYVYRSADPAGFEAEIHEYLSEYRLEGGEWFNLDAAEANDKIRERFDLDANNVHVHSEHRETHIQLDLPTIVTALGILAGIIYFLRQL